MDKLSFTLQDKKLYFASDFHLGAPNAKESRLREKKVIRWLDQVSQDAAAVFLVGDIFDFWFEYRRCIPKGFSRFLGKLAELRDREIPIYIFTGNHDMWMFEYFPKEFGIPVFKKPIELSVNDKKIFLGHGDGLGPGDSTYKFLKKVFNNRLLQWLFRWLHPDIGIFIAQQWSKRSRINSQQDGEEFKGEDEWLWQYCKQLEESEHHDFYIFGHRHLPLDLPVAKGSRYLNLGEWIGNYTYVVFEEQNATLEKFEA